MNPSVKDLLKAFEDLPGDQVILLPNNKNIQMSAEQAAKISAKQVLVLPTRTVPQGINAMLAFRPDGELDDVYEYLNGLFWTGLSTRHDIIRGAQGWRCVIRKENVNA